MVSRLTFLDLEVGAEGDVVAPSGKAFLPAGVRAVGMGVFDARHDLGHVRAAFENVVIDAQVQGLPYSRKFRNKWSSAYSVFPILSALLPAAIW